MIDGINSNTLLIVDNEEIFRREIADSLSQRSLPALTAETGTEALRTIENHKEISIILLDLRMPEQDGIQVAEKILTVRPDIAIIFLSGYDSVEFRERALEKDLRVECWMTKDGSPTELVSRIGDVVTRVMTRQGLRRCWTVFDSVDQEYPFSPEQRMLINRGLSKVLLRPQRLATQIPESAATIPMGQPLSIADVVEEIIIQLDELLLSYSDPTHRELIWKRIVHISENQLWGSADSPSVSMFVKQIALQVKLAIRRIASPQLKFNHINALYLCLERMKSERVDRTDVTSCKTKLRQVGIETLPSFRKLLENWREFYDDHQEEEEASFGDDDSDTSPGQ